MTTPIAIKTIRNTVTYTVNGRNYTTVLDRDRYLTRKGAERILNTERKAEGREPVLVERVEPMSYS